MSEMHSEAILKKNKLDNKNVSSEGAGSIKASKFGDASASTYLSVALICIWEGGKYH